MEWLSTFGPLIVTILVLGSLAGIASWRRRQFWSIEFDQGEMDRIADLLLADLRGYCSGPREPIRIEPSYWRDLGLSNDLLLKLLHYMGTRGWITLPNFDWRVQSIFRTELPMSIALTQSSYDEYTALRAPASLVVNGPAHFGVGDQVFNDQVEFNWQEVERRVDDLLLEIHRQLDRLDRDTAASLEHLAGILSRANDERDYGGAQVKPALRRLANFATDAASNAAGTGIAAAATAVLALLSQA